MLVTGLCVAALWTGCNGPAENPSDQLNGNFSGVYTQPTPVISVATAADGSAVTNITTVGAVIVTTNSGVPVTSLKITQNKGELVAVDNAGNVFTGTVKVAYANGGMIELYGTSAGVPVHIEGYMETSDTTAWITASWLEPTLNSPLYATTQVVPFSPTNPAVWRP